MKSGLMLGAGVVVLALLSSCVTPAPVDTSRSLGIPAEITPLACKRAGGTQTGIVGQACVFPTADAGKTCTDGDQCSSGECLADSDTARVGQCGAMTSNFGCAARLINGKSDGVICVD